jgi:acetyl-CoA carboxylase carboxyl transferase subunit beta
VEHDRGLTSTDPLTFSDTKAYRKRLEAGIASTGLKDAVITATGKINGIETVVSAMEYGFIGGSMGVVVGEKITRGIERAIARKLPVVIVSCSGGARMMEGALSLMQMAKISSALARLARARLPYISLLTDPTTGGVTASFAMLGDLNIAEPKALIGFAGPRVIEQTIRQTLPEGFQRSEFLLERGMLDIVVDRRELKDVITRVLRFAIAGEISQPRPAAIVPAGSVAVAPPAPVAPSAEPIEQSG